MEEIESITNGVLKDVGELSKKIESLREECRRESANEIAKLERERKEIQKQLAKLEALNEDMERGAKAQAERIRLNVGGTLFQTSRDTLMIEGSYFYAMLASRVWQPDEHGEYFIDRDPTYFSRILHGLRTGKLNMAGLSSDQMEELHLELDYYQIFKEEVIPKLKYNTSW
jgi:hypothetical protein